MKLLLEDTWQFTPDRQKIVESTSTIMGIELKTSEIPGILSQCDVKNGNGRRYRRAVWEKNLSSESRLMDLVRKNQAWGVLEHPKDGVVNVASPISHMVKDVRLRADGILEGKIVVFEELPDGFKLKSLIARGWDPLVSSRGFGSVVPAPDGIDEVQDDYVCEGWDVVSTPSFTICTLSPSRESRQAQPATVAESAPVPVQTSNNITIMNDINQLKSVITGLGQVNILAVPAQAMVESFATVQSLHQQLSEHQVAQPAAAYVCSTLHRQLEDIVTGWHKTVASQTEALNKASSDNEKLIKISESLAKTARTYRESLTTTVKNRNTISKVFETVTSRARKWVALAETRGTQNESLERQAEIACTAINMLAQKFVGTEKELTEHKTALRELAVKYHADTASLSRALVSTKHPEKVKEESIAKRLKEAHTADQVASVLDDIEIPYKAGDKLKNTEKGEAEIVKIDQEGIHIKLANGETLNFKLGSEENAEWARAEHEGQASPEGHEAPPQTGAIPALEAGNPGMAVPEKYKDLSEFLSKDPAGYIAARTAAAHQARRANPAMAANICDFMPKCTCNMCNQAQESAPQASAPSTATAVITEAVRTVRGDVIEGHSMTLEQTIGVIGRGRFNGTATK